jgi:hypothetical protein
MTNKIQAFVSLLIFSTLSFLPDSVIAAACLTNNLLAMNAPEKKNNIPPRLQWNANWGYCGEVELISAGLYYGQYMSQYEARAIASPTIPQSDKRSQLLIGVNALSAAQKMHLKAVEWDKLSGRTTSHFLKWVKKHVVKGHPVAIGVYMNKYLFDGKTSPCSGHSGYDHIVSVYGVKSHHPLNITRYFRNNIIFFSDNGLWSNPNRDPFKFKETFDAFQATRCQANAKQGNIYSLPDDVGNYGLVVKGVIDLDGDTLPVRVDTNVDYEKPAMRRGSNERPKPMQLTLTITVSGLEPDVKYNLYRYNNVEDVPNSKFNAHAKNASQHWQIQIESGSTYAFKQQIKSDDIVIYRAVRVSAP